MSEPATGQTSAFRRLLTRPSRRTSIIIGSVVVLAVAGTAIGLTVGGGGGKKNSAALAPTATPTPSSPAPTPKPRKPPVTCPLTGLRPDKGMNVHRVPLAVKIDNVDIARPQSGLDHADLVVEETVEGGLTRLFAVFQCDSAPVIGPVRSARTSDKDLLKLLRGGAIFGYSGSNGYVRNVIYNTHRVVALSYDANGGLYYRSGARPAPHNVFTSTSTLVRAGLARRHDLKAPPPLFAYAAAVPKARKMGAVSVAWSGFASAHWSWSNGRWQRFMNGTPDRLADGHRVTAANVVIMSIGTRFLGLHDVLGNASPDDVVTGAGRVWVLRNGRLIAGRWSRPKLWSPLRLTVHGRVIRLSPGRTWIELLPRPHLPQFG